MDDLELISRMAAYEAVELHHNAIRTEHILLGLIRGDRGIAAQVLAHAGLTLESMRAQVVALVGAGNEPPGYVPHLSEDATKVFSLSGTLTVQMNRKKTDTGVILLALLQEGGEGAVQALTNAGADPTWIQNEITSLMNTSGSTASSGVHPVRLTVGIILAVLGIVIAWIERSTYLTSANSRNAIVTIIGFLVLLIVGIVLMITSRRHQPE